jgi:hypothetical protein
MRIIPFANCCRVSNEIALKMKQKKKKSSRLMEITQ